MKSLLICFTVIQFYGCTSTTTNKKIEKLTRRVDSLEKNSIWGMDISPEDRSYKFDWFDLGISGHQIIGSLFYVSNIKTTFKDNGYQVNGTIGNISSMTISNAIIECAIRDSTTKEKVISGTSDIPTLSPSAKETFNVFIPTTKTNVSEIGVIIKEYRM